MQPTKLTQPTRAEAGHSQDRRCYCTQHFDWGMTQPYHLEGMQLCFLNIQISEVRCLFILCVTLFGPMWCMMSCSTLKCHLHGIASLTCLACIFTNLARWPGYQSVHCPRAGCTSFQGVVCTSVFIYISDVWELELESDSANIEYWVKSSTLPACRGFWRKVGFPGYD